MLHLSASMENERQDGDATIFIVVKQNQSNVTPYFLTIHAQLGPRRTMWNTAWDEPVGMA